MSEVYILIFTVKLKGGETVVPEIHRTAYKTAAKAEAARMKMPEPSKYWVRMVNVEKD